VDKVNPLYPLVPLILSVLLQVVMSLVPLQILF